MTDKNIIKALECLFGCVDCRECPYSPRYEFPLCRYQVAKDTRDLITRQKVEIERLKECPKCIYEYDGKTTEYCIQGPCSNFKTVEQIKSEAYKEFAERLKEEWFSNRYYSPDIDFDEFIDIMIKEYEKGR